MATQPHKQEHHKPHQQRPDTGAGLGAGLLLCCGVVAEDWLSSLQESVLGSWNAHKPKPHNAATTRLERFPAEGFWGKCFRGKVSGERSGGDWIGCGFWLRLNALRIGAFFVGGVTHSRRQRTNASGQAGGFPGGSGVLLVGLGAGGRVWVGTVCNALLSVVKALAVSPSPLFEDM